MHIDTTTPTPAFMQEGLEQIAALRDGAQEGHIAEHIRGMVAATMGHLSVESTNTTKSDAQQWQEWALGVADGLALPVAV